LLSRRINFENARFAVRKTKWRKKVIAGMHPSEWLIFGLAGWLVISLASLPLVGRFLSGAVREAADKPLRAAAPVVTESRARRAENVGIAVSSTHS
jgi:hypothetical protein